MQALYAIAGSLVYNNIGVDRDSKSLPTAT